MNVFLALAVLLGFALLGVMLWHAGGAVNTGNTTVYGTTFDPPDQYTSVADHPSPSPSTAQSRSAAPSDGTVSSAEPEDGGSDGGGGG